METIIGRPYRTRVGWVVLADRDVTAVERDLVEVDADVAILQGNGVVRCRRELADRLARWLELMWAIAEGRAAGAPARRGVIVATSAYRALGTSCALGTPFADVAGALDSQDDWGHWSGWAVDVPTRFTRELFSPVLTIEECWAAATRAGLVRPFREEYWHWRPARTYIGKGERYAL